VQFTILEQWCRCEWERIYFFGWPAS